MNANHENNTERDYSIEFSALKHKADTLPQRKIESQEKLVEQHRQEQKRLDGIVASDIQRLFPYAVQGLLARIEDRMNRLEYLFIETTEFTERGKPRNKTWFSELILQMHTDTRMYRCQQFLSKLQDVFESNGLPLHFHTSKVVGLAVSDTGEYLTIDEARQYFCSSEYYPVDSWYIPRYHMQPYEINRVTISVQWDKNNIWYPIPKKDEYAEILDCISAIVCGQRMLKR